MNLGEISKMQYRTVRSYRFCFSALALALGLLSGGCVTTGADANSAKNNLEVLLKEADTEIIAGQHDKAIATLNSAAKQNPTSTLPWIKIANIWFEKGNYPFSILAANEALQRDASNQEAKSLLVVAGLRVAASAVTGLRPSEAVNMNTRVEAENLTNSLRGALGEKVLVPPAEGKSTVSSSRAKAKAKTAALSAVASPRKADPSADSSDPFKSLK
ncbi:MAG TPA: hypothetical protein VJ654_06300 [Noviherbaspirillum sp.]|nr:hypothetical protein [Noviherbaspirillum sp.]